MRPTLAEYRDRLALITMTEGQGGPPRIAHTLQMPMSATTHISGRRSPVATPRGGHIRALVSWNAGVGTRTRPTCRMSRPSGSPTAGSQSAAHGRLRIVALLLVVIQQVQIGPDAAVDRRRCGKKRLH